MTEPVIKRPRAPVAIALAIMLLACALIVTALALLAQGAVAYELPSERLSESNPGAREPAVAARDLVSQQNDQSRDHSPAPETRRGAHAGHSAVTGSFTLGVAPTPAEQSLQDRIASSSAGGGFVARGQIHVSIEGRPIEGGVAADEPAQQ